MSHWEETQVLLEGMCFLAGLGTPWESLGRAGSSDWADGRLGHSPIPDYKDSNPWMDLNEKFLKEYHAMMCLQGQKKELMNSGSREI